MFILFYTDHTLVVSEDLAIEGPELSKTNSNKGLVPNFYK